MTAAAGGARLGHRDETSGLIADAPAPNRL